MEKPAPDSQEAPSNESAGGLRSSEVADLMRVIESEGRALREEARREDKAKATAGVFLQVHEMIKAYEPIFDQAVATGKFADTLSKQSAFAARQADSAEQTLVMAQRAWVGARNASFREQPAVARPLEVTVEYQNTGREPAIDMNQYVRVFAARLDDGQGVERQAQSYLNECQYQVVGSGGIVVYPSPVAGGSYRYQWTTNDGAVDSEVIAGKKYLVVQGCFLYRTFNKLKRSAVCYFFLKNVSRIEALAPCRVGNYAD